MPAVDLTEMAERLEKDWFHQYMMFPQKFSPNTVMPSFWPGGVAIRKDLEGDASTQIEALWQYLIDGRQAGTPRGVVREPLEIVVTNTPRMLRRKYPGIGKRGIGVGYPGGVNLAFDAEQMRLGLLWKGEICRSGRSLDGPGFGQCQTDGSPRHSAAWSGTGRSGSTVAGRRRSPPEPSIPRVRAGQGAPADAAVRIR